MGKIPYEKPFWIGTQTLTPTMLPYLVIIAFLAFLAFVIPGPHRKYAAIAGWLALVLSLFAGIPENISENNFLYPFLAVLSIPFMVITGKYLLREERLVFQLTRGAAIGFVIYAPFAFVPELGNWLIAVVVGQTKYVLDLLGSGAYLVAWDTFERNVTGFPFRVQIILACTGIQGIAIMLGVAGAVRTTLRQKVIAFLLVFPTIYILNLVRNAAVIIAYTGQWFPYFPEIAGNGEYGYESFFWAHNVAAELLALVFLVGIAYGLFRLIPDLGTFAVGLYDLYENEVRGWFGKDPGGA